MLKYECYAQVKIQYRCNNNETVKESRKPYFRRFLGFFVMHFLFGCCREILNCVKPLKGAILRRFYIKSFCLVTTVCTVDFEIPKFLAVSRTVALLSIM